MAKTRDVARASLYRAPINLWVEDEVSRTYLAEIWSNPAVGFLIGGGSDGVRAIVHDAEAERLWFDVIEVISGDREAQAKLEQLRCRLSLIGRV